MCERERRREGGIRAGVYVCVRERGGEEGGEGHVCLWWGRAPSLRCVCERGGVHVFTHKHSPMYTHTHAHTHPALPSFPGVCVCVCVTGCGMMAERWSHTHTQLMRWKARGLSGGHSNGHANGQAGKCGCTCV